MSLVLPGSRGLFSQMQEALRHVNGKQVTLTRVVHEELADFQWLEEDMVSHPTHLFELVPLTPTPNGYHDSSGRMCGVVVLPGPSAVPVSCRSSLALLFRQRANWLRTPLFGAFPTPRMWLTAWSPTKSRGGHQQLGLGARRGCFSTFCAADSYDVR